MRILITGASGFAGSYLVEALLNDSDDIFAVSKSSSREDFGRLKWSSCDLADSNAVEKLIQATSPAQIYHLAAFSSPGESFKHPLETVNDTASIQINLFESCLKAKITPRVLVISSGQIYGKSDKLPITEDVPLDCSSPYAVAKLCQENLANYYSKRGFEIVIARPFNHIGPRQQLGFLISDLTNQIALAEKNKEDVIRVGNLTSKRDFTDVRDIVRAYKTLMEKGTPGDVYNVCSGRSISGQTILDSLLKFAKRDIKTEVDESRIRPSDIPDLYGDYSKLTQATGWAPRILLDQTLEETLNYWRQQLK